MARKILIILTIALATVVAGLLVFYFFIKTTYKPQPAFHAIPEGAGLIVSVKDPFTQSKDLFRTEFWQGFDTVGAIPSFVSGIAFIDSLLRTNEKTMELMKGTELFIAMYPSEGSFQSLFILELRSKVSDNFMEQFIQNANKNSRLEKINADGTQIRSIRTIDGNRQFCFTQANGLFISSLRFDLVDASLRQLKTEHHWLSHGGMHWIRQSVDQSNKMNLYFHPANFSAMLHPFISDEYAGILKEVSGLALWGGGKMEWDDQSVSVNGTMWADSSAYFLNLLKKSRNPEENIASKLPSNTMYFVEYSWNEALQETYLRSLEGDEVMPDTNWADQLRDRMCFFMTDAGSGKAYSLALLDYNDAAGKWVEMAEPLQDTGFAMQVGTYPIIRLKHDAGIHAFPFAVLQEDEPLYATLVDEVIVLSPEPEALQDYIGKWISSQTLAGTTSYNEWSKKTGKGGVLTFFMRPSVMRSYFTNTFSVRGADLLHRYQVLMKLSTSAGMVIYPRSGHFGFHFVSVMSSGFSDQLDMNWELDLSGPVVSDPMIVGYQSDTTGKILVQDSLNMLYACDHDGIMKWKRGLDSRITGPSYPVNFYDGGSQLLFATSGFVYLVDEEGKNMPGFPVEVSDGTDYGVLYVKYEGDEGHRILCPSTNGALLIWDKNGSRVEGWQKPGTGPYRSFEYMKAGNKDYYLALMQNGTVWVGDRQGKTLLELKEKIKNNSGNILWVKNNSLASSGIVYADEKGVCHITYLENSKSDDHYQTIPGAQLITYLDADRDGIKEFYVSDGQKLVKVSREGSTLASFDLPFSASELPRCAWINDRFYLLAPVQKEEKLYVLDHQLNLVQGFPVLGSAHAVFMNKGSDEYTYLITSNFSKLLSYQLNFAD